VRLTGRIALPCFLAALGVFLASSQAPAAAHPLGNFTINHLAKVDLERNALRVRYVLDFAEIPTFQILRTLAPSGTPIHDQLAHWARGTVTAVQANLDVESAGRRLNLSPGEPRLAMRRGAGGLPTLYVSTDLYVRPFFAGSSGRIMVRDRNFANRIGWKDIVAGQASEPTQELRRYPNALLGSPRDVTAVVIALSGGRIVGQSSAAVADAAHRAASPRGHAELGAHLVFRGERDGHAHRLNPTLGLLVQLAREVLAHSCPIVVSVARQKFLASSRPSRPGACGAEAGVGSCARSVAHLHDALPRVLVASLAPAAEAANMSRTSAARHSKKD